MKKYEIRMSKSERNSNFKIQNPKWRDTSLFGHLVIPACFGLWISDFGFLFR